MHRDLKPSNILLTYDGDVRIADFGESGSLQNTRSYKKTLVGTMLYNSPERVGGLNYYPNCDIWSLGVLVLECAMGKYPLFTEKNLSIIEFEQLM